MWSQKDPDVNGLKRRDLDGQCRWTLLVGASIVSHYRITLRNADRE
jgi:hypothetical protein